MATLLLGAAITLLSTAELLAERAPSAVTAVPYTVAALAVFAGALPALAVSQFLWGSRARRARRVERLLFAAGDGPPARSLACRPAVALGWAALLLPALTLPRLFAHAGLADLALRLDRSARLLALGCCAAAIGFAVWWLHDLVTVLARARRPAVRDPWDPGRALPRSAGRARRAVRLPVGLVALAALLALLAARAHLWDPRAAEVCALAATALTALLVRHIVTRE